MIYPAYVNLDDEQHAHGAILPDFAGCFSAADNYADIPQNIQEALELYAEEDEEFEIPEPSDIEHLEASGEYAGGVWMLVDVDVSKLSSKPQRLNVSLPSHIVRQMDDYAARHHMTRSALIVMATRQLLASADEGR